MVGTRPAQEGTAKSAESPADSRGLSITPLFASTTTTSRDPAPGNGPRLLTGRAWRLYFGMARLRNPYWLPISVPNWLVCNFLAAAIIEFTAARNDFAWAARFPATKTLGAACLILFVLYRLGRVALLHFDGGAIWRPASLLEPGEPPVGNGLAWPSPGDAAARVATPAARALTKRKRHAPRDNGEGPPALLMAPLLGFLAAVPATFLSGIVSMDFMPYIWAAWGAMTWVCITASIALKTRRLNEDA